MLPESTRSGRFLRQTLGFRAFIPNSLPPEPPVQMTQSLQELLSKADRALGRLDGSIATLPNPNLFVYMYVRKEAVLSSQIEGTQSSLHDVLAMEAKILSETAPKDVDEVVNYVRAMNHGLRRLPQLPVSVRLIKEIHGELLQGVRGAHCTPGELRTSQNWIGPAGCTINTASFVPPPAHELGTALSELERFIHSESPLPLLVKIGLSHAQFETIHPFLDGNGRVGRLLITLLLCEQKVLLKPVLYLSHYFKLHRDDYYRKLQAIRDAGQWEEWLEFFLHGVAEVSNQATETARRVLQLREDHRRIITEKFGRAAGNGHKVLEQLYERPITSVNDVREIIGTSYPAANDLVTKLVANEILLPINRQSRNRRFLYRSYTTLFDDT